MNTSVNTSTSEMIVFHRFATENDINDAKNGLKK